MPTEPQEVTKKQPSKEDLAIKKLQDMTLQIKMPGFVLLDALAILGESLKINARTHSYFNSVVKNAVDMIVKQGDAPKPEAPQDAGVEDPIDATPIK